MEHRSRPWLKWYKRKEWLNLRKLHLAREPFCRFCKESKILNPSCVVDHIKPHRGDWSLFVDPQNLQALCKQCHDSIKQRIEKSGDYGCDVNGIVKSWQNAE